jgi:hypothetical protein
MKRNLNRLFRPQALLAALIVGLLAGCAGNYGRLEINKSVEQAFGKYQMLDHYQYYYSGRENKPSAIIGIDPAFQFSSKYWAPIEPSQFKKMVDRMVPEYGFLYGAYMMTPDGRKAGVWYSWVHIYTVKFEGNRIIVYSPEPFSDANDDGFSRSSL